MGWPLARKGCRCPEGVPTPGTVDRWLGMMAVLTWNNQEEHMRRSDAFRESSLSELAGKGCNDATRRELYGDSRPLWDY